MKGSPPPAWVVVTPPIELVGADETVPVLPTELLVVSPAVVVVPFTVVVVPFTVVVVAPLVVAAPEVVVAPLVVVPFTVVVVAPEVLVAPEVVVAPPVVVVSLAVVVVAPEVVVADASCPTLTPANTIRATMISQATGRLDAFRTCLAIDPYLLLFARPPGRTPRTGQTTQPPAPAIPDEVGAKPKEPRKPG